MIPLLSLSLSSFSQNDLDSIDWKGIHKIVIAYDSCLSYTEHLETVIAFQEAILKGDETTIKLMSQKYEAERNLRFEAEELNAAYLEEITKANRMIRRRNDWIKGLSATVFILGITEYFTLKVAL